MLHVVQSIESLTPEKGGPSRTVAQLSSALSNLRDTRVSIVCADPADPVADNIDCHTTFHKVHGNSDNVVVHDNGLWRLSNFFAARTAVGLRVPLVISTHGMIEPWALNHHRLRKQLAMVLYQRWCLRRAAGFHATCHEEASSMRRFGITQPIAVIANGIEAVPASVQEESSGSRSALFLSRLHPKKGVLELLEAWARIRPANWILTIVGPDDGGHRHKIEQRIVQLGLTNTVQLLGEATDVEKWAHYRRAQLFVLPTFSENFGLVIGEALAAGVPVITTTATPWQAIDTKGCGWIISPTVDALARTLEIATRLPQQTLTDMGKIGQQWIPQEFSWQNISEQMREFYFWLVNGSPATQRPSFVV